MPRPSHAILMRLLDESVRTRDPSRLMRFLKHESRLPGPRGNLEIARAFGDGVASRAAPARSALWDLCNHLTQLTPEEAPENTPAGFLPVCGALALGALAAGAPDLAVRALGRLKALAADPRWRTREGAAMGVQRLLATSPAPTLRVLTRWVRGDDWLAMRAVAAAVAEPALLRDLTTVEAAVRLHRAIITRVLAARERTGEGFRILRQALGYSISVVATVAPREGFELLRILAASRDPDGLWIVRENLKKHRLAAGFPRHAAALAAQVSKGTRR